MKVMTIDFETFYSQEYSLTKMTTEEYVRGEEFEVIGVSVQVDDGEPQWFSGTMSDTEEWLRQFDFENNFALAHNAAFDAAILTWLFERKPKKWLDTLSMGRALHGSEVGGSLAVLAEHYGLGVKGTEVINAKGLRRTDFPADQLARYGEYCKNDVALTYKLFQAMIDSGFPVSELTLIDLTIKMYSDPVLVLESSVLAKHLEHLQHKRQALLLAYDEKSLMSNPQFADALRSFGVEPPMKKSPTTGKQTYAFSKTDEEFKALLEHEDPNVQHLVAARLGAKSTLEHTRTQRFIDMAKRNPLLPVPLRYYAAHTGRWGGCLVADTEVAVYDPKVGVVTKQIVDVLADDLVWDGEEFVPHEGVQFSGFQEVITWDNVTGTPDHVVFTDAGEISLREAMQGGHKIQTPRSPAQDDVDAAGRFTSLYKG